jgi:hypothetical protein
LLFLLSDAAAFIAGQTQVVDVGVTRLTCADTARVSAKLSP